MLIPLILELLALLSVGLAIGACPRRTEDWAKRRNRIVIPLGIAGVLLTAAATINAMRYFGAPGAEKAALLGARSDLQSRALKWLEQHEKEPPEKSEVGRNMRIIRDGLPFLRPYMGQLPKDLQNRLEEAAHLPTQITRILTATEERKYYEGAQAVFESVALLAGGVEAKS